MQDLIGRHFQLDGQDFAITDIRNIGAETMVYAEPQSGSAGSQRAAFRYADLESLLSDPVDALVQVG